MAKRDNNDFKDLYCSCFLRIKNFANTYLADEEMASSVAQDVFMSVYEHRATLVCNQTLLPYLFVLAKNRCLNILKKEKSRRRYCDFAIEALEEIPNNYDYNIIQTIYQDILSSLPHNVRETFLLSRDNSLKYKEIAEVQKIAVKTVEYRIMYVLRVLRQKLKGYIALLLLLI